MALLRILRELLSPRSDFGEALADMAPKHPDAQRQEI